MSKGPLYFVQWCGSTFQGLKREGFKFWKAFARNYRVYTWSHTEHGENINIWQHLGGYLEIRDLGDYSYLIVEAIAKDELYKIKSGNDNGQYWIAIDLEKYRIVDQFTDSEHDKDRAEKYYQHGKPYNEELATEYLNRWRTYNLQQTTVDKLKWLLEKKWIKVQYIFYRKGRNESLPA